MHNVKIKAKRRVYELESQARVKPIRIIQRQEVGQAYKIYAEQQTVQDFTSHLWGSIELPTPGRIGQVGEHLNKSLSGNLREDRAIEQGIPGQPLM